MKWLHKSEEQRKRDIVSLANYEEVDYKDYPDIILLSFVVHTMESLLKAYEEMFHNIEKAYYRKNPK